MDIEKLEHLSALKIDDNIKDSLDKSLSDIVDMLHAIDEINISSVPVIQLKESNLVNDEVDSEYLENKNNTILNSQEGFFLAPKVISK